MRRSNMRIINAPAMATDKIITIKLAIQEVLEDATVSKNVKARLEQVMTILDDTGDVSVRINRVLHELDELSNDSNLQSYTRTQVWHMASLLENI